MAQSLTIDLRASDFANRVVLAGIYKTVALRARPRPWHVAHGLAAKQDMPEIWEIFPMAGRALAHIFPSKNGCLYRLKLVREAVQRYWALGWQEVFYVLYLFVNGCSNRDFSQLWNDNNNLQKGGILENEKRT